MSVNIKTGIDEEELLRQQREAEERALQEQERAAAEAKKAEEEAAAAAAENEKQAKAATEQAQKVAQDAAKQGAKVDIGPTNRPFTDEQSFLLHQRKAVRDTDTDIVKTGDLERLPAELEPHREMLEEKNRKGEIIPSAVNDWGTNRIDINFGSIKDNNQAGFFATTLATDSDKLQFFKEYAARTGQNYYTLLNEAEAKLGNRLFSTPQTQTAKIKACNQGLSGLNLMDVDGNALDLNTATQPQIEQAIRMLPDTEDHKDAVAYLVKLGEMRGWTIDKDSLDFMDSADLTKKDYNDAVDEYNKLFTIGYTPENEQAYLEELAYIQDQGYKPRVQKQMEAALKKSYEARTEKTAPTLEEIQAAAEQEAADSPEKASLSFWQSVAAWDEKTQGRLTDFYRGVSDLFMGKGEAEKREIDPLLTEEKPEETAQADGRSVIASGGALTVGGQELNVSKPVASAGSMPPKEELFDVDAISSPTIRELLTEQMVGEKETQGPVQQEQTEEPKRYTRDIAYDPNMTDEQALAYYMGGGTLDARNREQIAWLTDDAVVRGVVTGLNPKDFNWDAGRSIYDGTQYWQYGPTIRNAAQIRDSGILTDDMNLSASLVLGRAVKMLREDAANPEKGISIPAGENMFEYMLSLPQYEGVRNSLTSITNAQKDIARISAENEIEAKNAHLADVQNWTEQVMAGNATPETLSMLADEYENGEYVNFNTDPTYARLKFQLGPRSDFFDDNGAFWTGDSAAAIEGQNIRTLGGVNQTYSEYKTALKSEAESILENYTVAAMRMGMTLEDYLGSAGIGNIGQILDIAYNNMQAAGSIYGKDTEAQQAVQTVVDNPESVGIGAAAWTGGRRAVEDRTARLMQASYLMLEQADYQATVKELTNSYFARYGEEAPQMYYSDLMAVIGSGQLSEATAQELLANIQTTPNIFEIGYEIDGGLLESLLRDPAETIARDVETLDAVIAKMPERERFTANLVGSAADMLYGMSVATAIGAVTGSPFAGSAVAWGLPAVDQKYDDLAGTGMTKNTRFYVSMAYGGATALANKAGTGGAMDIWGDLSKEAQRKAYMSKGMPGLIKASLKLAAQHGAQEAVEEAGEVGIDYVFDVTQDAVQAYDRGENPKLSRAFQITLGNIYETDVKEIGRELLTSAGMGFAMGGIFALAGAARSGYAAQKGVKMERKYGSISLARQIVDGEVELTEESVGKVYAQVQKDLSDPGFKRWIDSANAAAREQNNMVTAAMMGAGRESRNAAVKEANRAADYREKAAAAKRAAQTAESRWIELRQQVMDGDLSLVPAMTTAQQQMGKAFTALREAETAASKTETLATEKTRQWLAACGTFKSQAMGFYANRAKAQLDAIARQLAEKYEAEEAARIEAEERRNAETSREVAYAEDYLFAEEEAADTAIAEADELETMSDEELDGIIAELNAQIPEAEARIADVTSRREELGLDGESIQALVDQELTPLSSRKDRIIAREKGRFNSLFDRQMQLIEMENDESADQIQAEYDAVGNRLRGLGVDVDALMMRQYGIEPEEAEAAQETAQQAAEAEEEERATDSLSRQMEATQASLDAINPVRKHLASAPIYINESQSEDILSEEGLKSISQFNWRYGTQLTTDASKGAMPLDGHVLTDINDETPGVIDVNADPVGEILRILHAGKELTARQKKEKQEARELREKKKNVKQRRAEKVDALVKPIKTEEDAKKANDSASSVIKITPEHTNKQQKDIIAYHSAVNSDMYNAAQMFKANPGGTNKRILISEVKDREANDILNLTGVDVAGYVHAADRGFFTHVERRHGENGDHDKTMSVLEDVARVGWVIDNYDSVELIRDSNGNPEKSKAYRDKHDQPEMLIRYKKQLDGSVYVVEAVGENKWKRLWLVTAYIQKNGPVTQTQNQAVTQAPHAVNQPLGNARNAVASPATSSVAQGSGTVNTNSSIDAMASSGSASPAQQASQQKNRSKKAEASALKALQNLAKDMKVGLRIKSGQRFQSADARMSSGVLGYYKNGQRNAIVRSAEAGRLDVTGHEIGHAVQEQLGIKSNQQMISNWQSSFGNTAAYTPAQYDHEAFAEFFWRYLEDRNLAVSYAGDMFVDSFEQALRQKKLYKAVHKAQTLVSAYMSSEADAKIRSRIVNASEANKQDDGFNRRVVAIIDDTAATEPLQNVIRARTGEKSLSLEDNLRDTIRFNRRAGARAAEIMTTALVDQNGDVVGESMKAALSDVKGKDFDLFWEWMLAKHSLARDKAKGAKNQVFDEETIPTAEREAFVKTVEQEHPEFLTANDRFQKWRRLFMDTYLVSNGFLGENGAQLMDVLDAMYPNYVPTYRAKQKNDKRATLGGRNYQMRTATGSTEDVINPFDSFVTMVNSIVQMTADNDSKLKFADLYDRFGAPLPGETGAGFGWFANELTQDMQRVSVTTAGMREKIEKMLDDIGTDPDVIMQIGDIIGDEKVEYHGTGRVNMKNVITVRNVDGSKRYFEIYDPDLFTLLSGTNTMNQKGVLDGLANVTRMMSMLTTGSNPIFGVTNAMRDFQNSVNYGSWATSYADGAVKWLGALWDVLRNGEASKEYDALGGGGWTAYDTKTRKGAEQIRGEVFKGYNTSNVGRIGKMIGRKIWKAATFEKINEAIEKTSRLAEYKYGKHDLSTTEGRIEAFLAAQDVTTDFARRGNGQIARDLKNLIPFFNASMQGVYRNARQFTAQESDRAKTRFAKNIINSTLASALANAMLLKYLDDDEKEEFIYLSDDLKAKHMFLPNFAPDIFGNAALIRIPIDQNPVSYAVNAAVSNFIWKGENDNEFVIEIGAVADVIMDNLNPFGSTILDPAISILSNKNWYGGNIVPSYLESYDETNQYTEETPTPFVTLSKGLAQAGIKTSPMMLQYIAEQYTGYIGQTLIPALPSEKNDSGLIGSVLNSLVATARKRVTTDPLASNGVVSGVYDSFNTLQAIYKAGSSKRDFDIDYLNPRLNDMERRRAIREADDQIHSGGDIYDAKKEISAGYDKIDEINDRDDLTEEEKHVLVQRVRRDMVETALDVQEIMNDYDARYKNNGIIRRFLEGVFLN